MKAILSSAPLSQPSAMFFATLFEAVEREWGFVQDKVFSSEVRAKRASPF